MRLFDSLPSILLFSYTVLSQDIITGSNEEAAVATNPPGDAPPSSLRSYREYESTITVNVSSATSSYGSVAASISSMGVANASETTSTESSSSTSVTLLVGSQRPTATGNGTVSSNSIASQTSSIAQPSNTRPCNGHPDYCSRRYSNITQIGAHNSPFSRPGNVASNQELDVETQLEDGIRMRKHHHY